MTARVRPNQPTVEAADLAGLLVFGCAAMKQGIAKEAATNETELLEEVRREVKYSVGECCGEAEG